MENSKKLENLLNAIDEVQSFPDGSVRIKWKANVAHEIPGHNISYAEGSQVVKGYQVHLNPELEQSVRAISFNEIQQELDKAVSKGQEEVEKLGIQGCGLD